MRSKPESQMQIAFFQWVDVKANADERYKSIFAVPNGLWAKNIEAARKQKAEGMRSGVPDICVAYPNHSFFGAWFELKIRPNKPTKKQQQWLQRLKLNGYLSLTIWDLDKLIKVTEWYIESDNEFKKAV